MKTIRRWRENFLRAEDLIQLLLPLLVLLFGRLNHRSLQNFDQMLGVGITNSKKSRFSLTVVLAISKRPHFGACR